MIDIRIDLCSVLPNLLNIPLGEDVHKDELKGINRSPCKQWSMWFNLMQSEEPKY